MVAKCVAVIKAENFRLIKLDSCGLPVSGAGSAVVVSDGFVQIGVTPNYVDGQTFQQKKANGAMCVNEQDPSELVNVDLEIQLCTMNPDAIAIITGERLLTSGGATGTGVAYGEGPLTARFSLETWQPTTGDDACSPGGLPQYMYWLFGNTGNAKVNGFTFANDVFTYSLKAQTKRWNPLWPTKIGALTTGLNGDTIQSGEHWLHNVTTVAPPAIPAVCGAVPL